ncbi:MAG: hypothetical protein M1828_005276 [Chrysothrix sp. TS-e1954]|nr:MAG: hypothetical protein M1828_005276 [Chrysothrix sp. TS-e1954]
MSIQDRIAALNLGHVGRPPGPASPPAKPTAPKPFSSQAVTTEDVSFASEGQHQSVGNQPAYKQEVTAPVRAEPKRIPLPPPRPSYASSRTASQQTLSPSLRAPNGTAAMSRRDSNESIASTISTRSSISGQSTRTNDTVFSRTPSGDRQTSGGYRVPAYDPASLPVLPPKKSDQQNRPSLSSAKSSSSLRSSTPTPAPAKPPPLPQRRESSQPSPALPPRRDSSQAPPPPPRRVSTPLGHTNSNSEQARPALPDHGVTASYTNGHTSAVTPQKSALSFGLNKATEETPTVPDHPEPQTSPVADMPPPIPTASRPNLAALQASKPKVASTSSNLPHNSLQPSQKIRTACLKCRDFSAPDAHAERFPRNTINPKDVAGLAHKLTDPFRSATDKARAIFTWLHHNIAYDTVAFFSGNLKAATAGGTIASGLAVCEGYSGLFAALAIAAGLDCIAIHGHGAGFGFTPLAPGQAAPPFKCNHAWNAVRIDDGEWKLVEPCWGAGHLEGDKQFHKQFHTEWFTTDNNAFGAKHFPTQPEHFLRTDGKPPPSWTEYISGGGPGSAGLDTVTACGGIFEKYGLDGSTFLPRARQIPIRAKSPKERIQFLLSTPCEHWDATQRLGKPHVFFLAVQGEKEHIPFETDGHRHWWCDVTVEKLGRSGQKVTAYAVTSISGVDAKGVSVAEYRAAKGRKGMSWSGVAMWQLA